MIENGMVVGAEAEWERICLRTNHWDDDRSYETVEMYADDRDIIFKAVAHWLDVDDEDADRDRLDEVYDMMTRDKKKEIVEDYIEFYSLEGDFDEWYNGRYCYEEEDDGYEREYELEHGWRD